MVSKVCDEDKKMRISAVVFRSNCPTDSNPASPKSVYQSSLKPPETIENVSFKGNSGAGKFLAVVALSVLAAALYVLFRGAPKNTNCKDGHLSCVG